MEIIPSHSIQGRRSRAATQCLVMNANAHLVRTPASWEPKGYEQPGWQKQAWQAGLARKHRPLPKRNCGPSNLSKHTELSTGGFLVKRKSPVSRDGRQRQQADFTTPFFDRLQPAVQSTNTAKMTLPNVSQDLVWEIVRTCLTPWQLEVEWMGSSSNQSQGKRGLTSTKYRQQQLLPGQAQAGRWCPVLP